MTDPMPPAIWTPTREQIEGTTLWRFMQSLDRGFESYADLWEWSVTDLDGFWLAVWKFFDVASSGAPERALARRTMPFAEWFPGVELSYPEHVFRNRDDDAIAILHAAEDRAAAAVTWGDLRARTARIAAGLRAAGVGRGDRVAAYLPNVPETCAAFLATASLGALWSSAAPEFGVGSVVDRFAQIEPKVLLAADGYFYGGKTFRRGEAIETLRGALPTVEQIFVLPYVGDHGNWDKLELDTNALEFERVPFDHPLWILYSSGTTGLPKAIVQGQGGILLEHLKTLLLHFDLQADDRLFWFTTTGWMMWNLLVGGLLAEAPIVLFDGSPGFPNLDRLWDLAEETGTTCFGTSAAFISSCMKSGVHPKRGRQLAKLRAVGSTGSPLSPDGFRWVRDELGSGVWLFSTSGGTDVCTAFVGGVPILPVREGELQARSLGARVEAFDESGRPVVDQVGELVLTEPLPSMPLFLWNDDEEGTRYRETYFDAYPGVWRHGDWIRITREGGAVIYGRSDATINRGGVRIGTSEIYRCVLANPDVLDAIVVDIPREGTDGWMLLFVVTSNGELGEELPGKLKSEIRTGCSPRHVPDEIHRIAEVPRTLSGKALEIPVKRILMGTPPEQAASLESLANPASLQPFVDMAREANYR